MKLEMLSRHVIGRVLLKILQKIFWSIFLDTRTVGPVEYCYYVYTLYIIVVVKVYGLRCDV